MVKRLLQGLLGLALALEASTAYSAFPFKDTSQDNPRFGFYGQVDSISFSGDTTDTINHQENLQSCINMPRARYFLIGKSHDVTYYFAYDAAEEEVREAYFRYERFPCFWFTVGQFKAPYNIWFMTSQSQGNTLEISLPAQAFNLNFRTGVMAQFFSRYLTFSTAILGPQLDNTIRGEQVHGHIPLAGNGRITFVPLRTDCYVLHLAAASVIQETDSTNTLRFRAVPEVQAVHDHFLADTGRIPQCHSYVGVTGEGMLMLNSLMLGGEYFSNYVNRYAAADLNFTGYMFYADYFLTGEHYIYNFKCGCFNGISKIRHCYGAWELVYRYSEIDLDDNGIQGGIENNMTFGLNWWVNEHIRFQGNYILARAHPAENGTNRNVNIFALRFQLLL
jgi:phosphate-selective porin OprO/OprP